MIINTNEDIVNALEDAIFKLERLISKDPNHPTIAEICACLDRIFISLDIDRLNK
jgi:hypothetical protein